MASRFSGSGSSAISGIGQTVTSGTPAASPEVPGGPWLLTLGDSKTATGNSWPATVQAGLGFDLLVNNGVSGTTVATTVVNLSTVVPDGLRTLAPIVLINFGANDVSVLPAQGTWIANYRTIINGGILSKWPDARVYLMRPWRRNFDSACDSLATWIGEIVLAQPAQTFLGPDERVWLKGDDNGATETTDGIHYSAAGEVTCASEWLEVLP